MSKQRSFAEMAYQQKKRKTRREMFLAEMERIVPWGKIEGLIAPHYTKGEGGRPAMPLGRMLRIHCCQIWFNFSDPAMEDALYDIESVRRFAGLALAEDAIPDETTILQFRHLLERHGLAEKIFEAINAELRAKGLLVNTGTIVGATIIDAPSSTKNASGKRDPEMHQTSKGKQWYFGMKAHVGVDSQRKLIHSIVATGANVADSRMLPHRLHGEEDCVWGDQAYRGQSEVIHRRAPQARDCTQKRYRYKGRVDEVERAKNRTKSRVRSKVEHVFGVMKLKFGFTKVRYRRLLKNANRLFTTCALVNLFLVRKQLLCTTTG